MNNRPLKVGIAGLGTVGVALLKVLKDNAETIRNRCGREVVVAGINSRDKSRDRGFDLRKFEWFDDAKAMAASDSIDVFVELIGGEDGIALDAAREALAAGKHVVTANKAMLARHGVELAEAAETKGVLLNFEAAVAGGIPIIKTMRETLTANNVERVYGIMNGTCNYMLTRMEKEGISYEDCLADAQRLGYAEADPTFDVEGFDTAHKLAILTSLAFGNQIAPDEIYVEGISSITNADIEAAASLGYRIKLLGVAAKTESGIEQRVHPTMVPLDSTIAQISGVTNAVAIDADVVGNLVMSGPGAGGAATASAVAGDIADIAKCIDGEQLVPALGKPASELEPYQRARMRSHEGGYFIRMTVKDMAGVFARIANAMAKHNISLESIVQHGETSDQKTIILITHETTEAAVREALEAIGGDNFLSGQPQMIRIEK
ncbi:MAG: homoserine dehydrogenase [Pseudomonadota bacterium]